MKLARYEIKKFLVRWCVLGPILILTTIPLFIWSMMYLVVAVPLRGFGFYDTSDRVYGNFDAITDYYTIFLGKRVLTPIRRWGGLEEPAIWQILKKDDLE